MLLRKSSPRLLSLRLKLLSRSPSHQKVLAPFSSQCIGISYYSTSVLPPSWCRQIEVAKSSNNLFPEHSPYHGSSSNGGRRSSRRRNISATTATTTIRATSSTLHTLGSNKSSYRRSSSSSSSINAPPAKIVAATTFPAYTPPISGFISFIPRAWQPYAELSRLDKPAGTLYLFFPCAFSTLLASTLAAPNPPFVDVLSTTSLFFIGALIMRGAGCTINDLWDRSFDPLVARTRLRPIARGAVSPTRAFLWFNAQCLAGLAVLSQFPNTLDCMAYAIPSLALVATYPLAKRVTYYPQFVLGLAFSWGAIVGFPAMGVDLMASAPAVVAAAALYTSCIAWTLVYDMIYAYMDIRDDVKAGVKSIALRHETNAKPVMSALAAVQVGLLAVAGVAVGATPVYFVGTCGSAAATLATMILRVDLTSIESCWWWFKYGCCFTGGGIVGGLFAEYLTQFVSS